MGTFDRIAEIDWNLTKSIYKCIGDHENPLIRNLPTYAGLIPYQAYILPGMFISLLSLLYDNNLDLINFHLFPHVFAFTVSKLLKQHIGRVRPGCQGNGMTIREDPLYCKTHAKESFPSGHATIAFCMATSLAFYLKSERAKGKLFGKVDFDNSVVQNISIGLAYFVASMVCLHRITNGYHFVGDIAAGMILGAILSYISFKSTTRLQNGIDKTKDTTDNLERVENTIKIIGGIVCVLGLFQFIQTEAWKIADKK